MVRESEKKFIKNCRYFRITWSGLPKNLLNPKKILDFICSKIKREFKYCIGEELHPNPSDPEKPYHYHAWLDFGKGNKFKTENERFFDIEGIHPSMRGKFGPAYAGKDWNYVSNIPDIKEQIIALLDSLDESWKVSMEDIDKTSQPEFFKDVIEKVSVPQRAKTNRNIFWLWSEQGGVGKSIFINYLLDNIPGTYLFGGRHGDIAKVMSDKGKTQVKVAVFDLPRKMKSLSYAGVENLCDGHIFSWKNDSEGIRFRPPHVIVCCNFPIEKDNEYLSMDRFTVYNLDTALARRPSGEESDSE